MKLVLLFVFTLSTFAGVVVFADTVSAPSSEKQEVEINYGEDRYAPEKSTLLYCDRAGKTFVMPEMTKEVRSPGTVFEISEPDRK